MEPSLYKPQWNDLTMNKKRYTYLISLWMPSGSSVPLSETKSLQITPESLERCLMTLKKKKKKKDTLAQIYEALELNTN